MKNRLIATSYYIYCLTHISLMLAAMCAGPENVEVALIWILSLLPEFLYWLITGNQMIDVVGKLGVIK